MGMCTGVAMGAFFLTSFQLIQEVLDTSNQDTSAIAIALPAVAMQVQVERAAHYLNRLQLTNRQTLAEED